MIRYSCFKCRATERQPCAYPNRNYQECPHAIERRAVDDELIKAMASCTNLEELPCNACKGVHD